MRLAEVAGKRSCQISLSGAPGIFLLQAALAAAPSSGAATGQGKDRNETPPSWGAAICSRPTYRTLTSLNLQPFVLFFLVFPKESGTD